MRHPCANREANRTTRTRAFIGQQEDPKVREDRERLRKLEVERLLKAELGFVTHSRLLIRQHTSKR